jgi:PAS domain S-box-containing protein
MALGLAAGNGHELVVVAMGGALYAAFRLSQRSRRFEGALRMVWAAFAGLAAGGAVWTAHVASVLAHTGATASGYDPGLVLAALGLSTAGCLATFATAAWRTDREARVAAGFVLGLTSAGALVLLQNSAFLNPPLAYRAPGVAGFLMLSVASCAGAAVLAGDRRSGWRAVAAAALITCGLLFGADVLAGCMVASEAALAARQASAIENVHVAALAALICTILFIGGLGISVMHARGKNASMDRLRAAIDVMPAGLGFYDAEDRLQVWNGRYVEIMSEACRGMVRKGAGFRELIETDLAQGSYADARGREAEWLAERMAVRSAGQGAQTQQLDDGRWLRVEERRTPDGGVVTICIDVTDVKRQEESFRLLFAANPVPMWLWEPGTLRFLDINEAAQATYGMTRADAQTLTLDDFLDEEERAALRELAARKVKTYRGERVWRHQTRYGTELHVLPYVQLATWEGRPALLAAMVDVTERIRVEEELQRHARALEEARDEAEAANRAKSEFLANMSHEIRTPLNGVVAVADVLARTELTPEQREMIELVRNSGVTLERLLSDVLDLARVEAGRFELEREPFDLRRAVKDVATLAELKAAEKNVPVRLSVADDAPTGVLGDVTRFKQVLTNLMSNAVKFTDAGEVRLEVTVDADGATRFTVTDTGAGFDAAQKDRIFARFEQADGSITRRFGGTGLGLAISRELASLMGGSLDCVSEPGVGSVFSVVLPLERTALTEAAPPARPGPAEAAGARPLRILLADDHPTNRKVVQLILEPLGVDLVSVEDGAQALEAFAGGGFDLVLMDMQMPVADGLTATREIRRLEAQSGAARTPVVMLTANAMPEHVAAGAAAGADRHLTKPIHADALIEAIEAALDNAAEARAAA